MSVMVPYDIYFPIAHLFARYANCLDEHRLDEWVDCFADEARYCVLSRENLERKLPLTLLQLDNKSMMRDRVLSLREANVTNIHRDQHLTGLPQIEALRGDDWTVVSGYAMYTTNAEGKSTLFGVGSYRDIVRVRDGVAKFVERIVIADTFAIPNMLSTPI